MDIESLFQQKQKIVLYSLVTQSNYTAVFNAQSYFDHNNDINNNTMD